MSINITSDEIINLLRDLHHPKEWAFFEELRIGGGYGKDSDQRLDAWAINYLPSRRNKTVCYEIKASRGDFFREIKKPIKRRAGLRLSNEFYFVTPKDLVKIEEIPPECGLIEVHGGKLNVTVRAPFRDILPPTFNFLASVCRRFDKPRLLEYLAAKDASHSLHSEGSAVMMALNRHIKKWKDFNYGNKEVPDQIARALEDLKIEVMEILDANPLIK